jgi:(p)ppGpp synthase/HD superfamily hydrolase
MAMRVTTLTPVWARRLPETHAALDFAKAAHTGQVRAGDGAPFVEHPREVAELLYSAGAPDHVIAAGALHDVLEKTAATAFDLRRRFGTEVASLVLLVTEDRSIKRFSKRKAALRERMATAGEEALMLFAADKISKVRELARRPPRFGLRARVERRRRLVHYRRSHALLASRMPRSRLVDQLGSELAALR